MKCPKCSDLMVEKLLLVSRYWHCDRCERSGGGSATAGAPSERKTVREHLSDSTRPVMQSSSKSIGDPFYGYNHPVPGGAAKHAGGPATLIGGGGGGGSGRTQIQGTKRIGNHYKSEYPKLSRDDCPECLSHRYATCRCWDVVLVPGNKNPNRRKTSLRLGRYDTGTSIEVDLFNGDVINVNRLRYTIREDATYEVYEHTAFKL